MTREEAIGIIKSECYIFDPLNLDRSTMVNTALDMAIILLEQETVPKEYYDHEYFLRKEYEVKIAKLERTIETLKKV